MGRIQKFLRSEDGPVLVEYAVMLALIIAVCVSAISLVGGGSVNFWQNNQEQLDAYLGGS